MRNRGGHCTVDKRRSREGDGENEKGERNEVKRIWTNVRKRN